MLTWEWELSAVSYVYCIVDTYMIRKELRQCCYRFNGALLAVCPDYTNKLTFKTSWHYILWSVIVRVNCKLISLSGYMASTCKSTIWWHINVIQSQAIGDMLIKTRSHAGPSQVPVTCSSGPGQLSIACSMYCKRWKAAPRNEITLYSGSNFIRCIDIHWITARSIIWLWEPLSIL